MSDQPVTLYPATIAELKRKAWSRGQLSGKREGVLEEHERLQSVLEAARSVARAILDAEGTMRPPDTRKPLRALLQALRDAEELDGGD